MKRQIRIEGEVAYIPLTRGYEAVIDATDVHLVDRWNWCAEPRSRAVYAVRQAWENGAQHKVYLHRAISPGFGDKVIDHRDGDGLNNRRANLRSATLSENQHNRGAKNNNRHGLKGVSFDNRRNVWFSQIMCHRKYKYLGAFETKEAAHQAYVEASALLHGDFSRADMPQ